MPEKQYPRMSIKAVRWQNQTLFWRVIELRWPNDAFPFVAFKSLTFEDAREYVAYRLNPPRRRQLRRTLRAVNPHDDFDG